jgi:cytidylate kinase
VALDGPAGAGKSTVARRVADDLGFTLVDTGAIYRSVALASQRAVIDWADALRVTALAERLAAGALVMEAGSGGGLRVLIDGEDASLAIRAPEISLGASQVSAFPGVRAALMQLQRGAATTGGVVLEGRDIGTVVVPDAEAKFFVTASPEVRARRRFDELRARGAEASYEATLAEVIKRDHDDSTRAVAPLLAAPDAELVDTSALSIDAVVAHIVERVETLRRRRRG